VAEEAEEYLSPEQLAAQIEQAKQEMRQAAAALEFERAAELRDRLQRLEQRALGVKTEPGGNAPAAPLAADSKPTVWSRPPKTSRGRGAGKAATRGRMARWQK
jgi:excinuclease ABC subunit B